MVLPWLPRLFPKDIFQINKLDMVDALIVLHFEIFIINVCEMQIGSIILQVLKIMEVPLPQSQIGPCLKCDLIW